MKTHLFLFFLCLSVVLCFASGTGIEWYDGRSPGGWERQSKNPQIDYDEEAGAVLLHCAPHEEGKSSWQSFLYMRPYPPFLSHLTIVVRSLSGQKAVVRLTAYGTRESLPGCISREGWTSRQRRDLPGDGEWHELTFDFAGGWHQNGKQDDEAIPPFQPVDKIGVVFSEIPPDTAADFQIRSIRLWEEETPRVETPGFAELFSGKAEGFVAGEAIPLPNLQVIFSERLPNDKRAFFAVSAPVGTQRDWTLPLQFAEEGQTWNISAQEILLPKSLPSGKYRVWLQMGELRGDAVEVNVRGVEEIGFRLVERRQGDWGYPSIFLDGKPHSGLMRATFAPGRKGVQAFAEAGIDLFGFDTNVSEGGFDLSAMTERTPGVFDWTQFEQRMQEVLEVSPDAMVILRLFMGTPVWWAIDHAGELVCQQDEEDRVVPFIYHRNIQPASWSSLEWRELMAERLRRFISYLEKTPYARHVAGFVLGCGSGEEWMQWDNWNVWTDYSAASQAAFRRWLSARYGTDEALQKAWEQPEVTLGTAAIPPRSLRDEIKEPMQQRQLYLPGQPNARWITDHARYLSEDAASCIDYFAHTLKEACNGRLLVGSFYGYAMELSGRTVANSAHLDARRLMLSPDLDFFCSPTSYTYRQVGGKGTVLPMGADASLRLHGKFWFVEMDVRTYATEVDVGVYGRPDTEEGDLLQQDKEAVRSLCTGQAQWWFDVGGIPYTNPAMMTEIGRLVKLFQPENAWWRKGRSVAEIAVIIDEQSLGLINPNDYFAYDLLRGVQPDLARLGTTVEYYLASDLEMLPERIRMVVFPCAFAPDSQQQRAIELLKSQGRVLVFLYGPGVADTEDPEAAMTAVTGLPFALRKEGLPAKAELDTPDGKYLPETMTGRTLFGSEGRRYTPAPCVLEAEGVRILGHYPDGSGAVAVREFPEWTSAYSAVAPFPRELWLSLAKKAGIHRFLHDPDQVWATETLLGVSVASPGPRTIHLPDDGMDVVLVDLLSGEEFVLDEKKCAVVDFSEGATRVFGRRKASEESLPQKP